VFAPVSVVAAVHYIALHSIPVARIWLYGSSSSTAEAANSASCIAAAAAFVCCLKSLGFGKSKWVR